MLTTVLLCAVCLTLINASPEAHRGVMAEGDRVLLVV